MIASALPGPDTADKLATVRAAETDKRLRAMCEKALAYQWPSISRFGCRMQCGGQTTMSATLRDDVIYSCPECGSSNVCVNLFCWVDANNTDHVEVDFETDVGFSTKWFCNDCENDNFLPDEHGLGSCPDCGLSRDAGYGDCGCEGCGT